MGRHKFFYNGRADKFLFNGGYCSSTANNQPVYHYYTQDHLGNNRAVVNENGTLEQVTHYYPFGGVYGDAGSTPDCQDRKYNGKEYDHIHGLDWYDYGARSYDPALATWTSVDPLAEKYPNISPYAYCVDNPVNAIDVDGDSITILDEAGNPFLYEPTLTYSGQNEFVKTIFGYFDNLSKDERGTVVVNRLVKSKNNYSFRLGSPVKNTAGEFDEKTLTTTLSDTNTLTFAEELFHTFQHDNGETGKTAVREVEAKLFSAVMNYDICGWNIIGASNKIAGIGIYAESMEDLLYNGYSQKSYSTAVQNFLTESLGGPTYKNFGYSTGVLSQHPLIKNFIPIK